MLPNGKAIFFGATQYNAIYTPSGDTTPGTWTQAADFPTINGSPVGQTDAAGAMMVNGKILCAVSPIGINGNDDIAPIYFVEYDYTTDTFTQVKSIIPGFKGDSIPNTVDFQSNMLDLPDGNVLFVVDQSDYSHLYWVYTPGSAAIVAGKPAIDSIIPDGCPNYLITGKLFNGISEGAAFGDDWQMATNYPIVRLTNGSNVYYGRTTLWNRIGAVQTGNLEDSVVFTPPSSLPAATYSLVVIANGNPSDPVSFIMPATIITPDSVTICNGLSVNLIASGCVTYLWAPTTGLNTSTGDTAIANPSLTTTYIVTGTDINGCLSSDSIVVNVETCTDIKQALADNGQLTIYPNPTSGQFNIQYNGNQNGYKLEIYNTMGERVYQSIIGALPSPLLGGEGPGVRQIDLTSQPAGLYFVYLKSDESAEVGKVSVTK